MLWLRSYLRDGERHLKAAEVLFENELYDYSVREAYMSMLHNIDALLLTEGIRTTKSHAAIAFFGRKFVKEKIYPISIYEHLLISYAENRIAMSEFGETISRGEAEYLLNYAREFGDLVAYLREFKAMPNHQPAELSPTKTPDTEGGETDEQ